MTPILADKNLFQAFDQPRFDARPILAAADESMNSMPILVRQPVPRQRRHEYSARVMIEKSSYVRIVLYKFKHKVNPIEVLTCSRN